MQGLLLHLKKQVHLYCYRTTNLFNSLWFFTPALATAIGQKDLSHITCLTVLDTES